MKDRAAHTDASLNAGGRFPGYGESAPLDLHTHASAQAVMGRMLDGTFDAFADTAAQVGYCARPVRLVGHSETFDPTTGAVVSRFDSAGLPLGVLYRPCGNRRAEVCPSCSRTYARDTFAMIRAGLVGGKTIPDDVAENPLLFVTFTAPSFGHVHGPRCGTPRGGGLRVCRHGQPTVCRRSHGEDDEVVGAPLCAGCYDWRSAVIWQWWAPELWRRTTIALRRAIAHQLGIAESRLRDAASVQFAKVAEYQARGLVHFHALIRLDGPHGPGSPAPLTGDQLAPIINHAAKQVEYVAPPIDSSDRERVLAWGRQLDVRVVRDGSRTDEPDGPLVPEQVAGYLAKYATKDANSLRDNHDGPRPHLLRLRATVEALSRRARRHDASVDAPYRLLGKWAHMYGFRGHFSSKSRRYSITLGRLRRARQRYAALVAQGGHPEALDVRDLDALLLAQDEEETTLVVGSWAYQGTGWTRPGDEALALAAAARACEYDRWRARGRSGHISGEDRENG